MKLKISVIEIFILSTLIGVIATFAAPWVELRGTFAAWNIIEWHTFWRGQDAFQLADVVAANYSVPIEYATTEMQTTMRNLPVLGGVLGTWHLVALAILLTFSARWRISNGVPKKRIALEMLALIIVNFTLLCLLAIILAFPSTLTQKVDFRANGEVVHTNSLIWSSVNVLPIAPIFGMLAIIGQIPSGIMLFYRTRTKIGS